VSARFAGRVAVVTGAASGIGRATPMIRAGGVRAAASPDEARARAVNGGLYMA
jgi:NAD(P)-dependent dehydrogenase (short-subunit alcohol dehydrogenase family)